jgi:superfamily II DNA/RNA helicase
MLSVAFGSPLLLTISQVEDLARLSLQKPVYVGVDDKREHSTAAGLEQGYCVTPSENRFLLLFTFLKKNLKKKVRVPVRYDTFGKTCAALDPTTST